MTDRIIDRDIEFYEGEVERCKLELRRCEPRHEPRWSIARDRADRVVRALKRYALYFDPPAETRRKAPISCAVTKPLNKIL